MTVNSVNLQNFRNIPSAQLVPSDGVNVLYGENAQGKTNLLEAIWLFTGCKSFRGAKDADFITFDEQISKSSLCFTGSVREKKAEIIIGDKKRVTLNGVELKSSADLIGEFYAVIFAPSHLSLIKNGPELRRRFTDTALCELKPKYANYLRLYKQALTQRGSILRDIRYSTELYDLLDSWDNELAKYAAVIIRERLFYTSYLSHYCDEIYSGISEGKEKITVSYQTAPLEVFSGSDKIPDAKDIYLCLLDELKKKRREDVLMKQTSVGPHRDDLEILINGKSARAFGSQGQQRSCALALKLSEAQIIENITGESPVALLDDVMSELDEKRQDYVLNHIKDRQVFLTCCDPSQVTRLCSGKMFYINNGTVTEK